MNWRSDARGTALRLSGAAAALVYLGFLTQSRGGLTDRGLGPILDPDPWSILGHAAAGVLLLVAGATALIAGTSVRSGVLGIAAGVVWFGPDLTGLASDLPAVRALGDGTTPLAIPALTLVVLSLGWIRDGRTRWRVTLALTGIAALVGILRWLTYAPFFDPRCQDACAFIEAIVEVTTRERTALRAGSAAIVAVSGAWLVGLSLQRLGRARPTRPRHLVPWVGGLAAGAGAIVGTVSVVIGDATGVHSGAPLAEVGGHLLSAAGVLAIGGSLLAVVVAAIATRRRIRLMTGDLASVPEPGSLRDALAGALGDPMLRAGYWWAEDERFVDVEGAPLDARPAGANRAVTRIQRGGSLIAAVEHPAELEADDLTRQLRPSVLVALDNERLRATRLAQLRELRASRARIVAVGDAERRRVERDLHDGAQQRLLAITFDLRIGRLTAEREGDTARASLLAAAETLALRAVDELRRICRGIHPQVLTQAGLAPALASLGEEADLPIEVRGADPGRLPDAVETAAYQVVTEALAQAGRRGARDVSVELGTSGGTLTLETSDGRTEPLDLPIKLLDRVGAAGGELTAGVGPRGAFMRAVMPCA